MTNEYFNLLSLIVTIAGFSTTAIGLLFIWKQILQAQKSRDVEISMQLAAMSSDSHLQSSIDCLWAKDDFENISMEEERHIKRVCVFFELVGSICINEYMSTTLIEGFYGSLVTGMFDKLLDYIESIRQKPYHMNYCRNFEMLAETIRHEAG